MDGEDPAAATDELLKGVTPVADEPFGFRFFRVRGAAQENDRLEALEAARREDCGILARDDRQSPPCGYLAHGLDSRRGGIVPVTGRSGIDENGALARFLRSGGRWRRDQEGQQEQDQASHLIPSLLRSLN